MKHPGIYLHTDPADPASPLWMLHLSSLTLACLHLSEDEAPHRLTVDADSPPPDAALEGFAAVIESMSPGASRHLVMITRREPHPQPFILNLATADGTPGFLTYCAWDEQSLAIGYTPGREPIGPIWSDTAPTGQLRESLIKLLVGHARTEIDLAFELPPGMSYVGHLWSSRPDLIARTAQPATAG